MKLKKIMYAACLAAMGLGSTSCSNDNKVNFSGELSGVTSDSLLLYIYDMNASDLLRVDTVAMKDGRFAAQVPDTTVLGIQMIPLMHPVNGMMPAMPMTAPVIFLPGEKAQVTGSLEKYQVKGSAIYEGLAKLSAYNTVEEKIKTLSQQFQKYYAESNNQPEQSVVDSLSQVMQGYMQELSQAAFQAIKENPESPVAGFLSLQLPPQEGLEAIGLLGEKVKNGPLSQMIAQAKKGYESAMAKMKAADNVKAGKMAPDFKLKDLNGKEVSLATFKGKYVLLDFWGTWCGWCIKGMPEMKQYYDKYKGKIEFVGIDCGDTEEDWKAAVAKHGMNWTNLYSGDDTQVTNAYAVSGFPTKVLIDADGKIVEVFVGETPELYKKLDSLFGK